MDPFAPSLSPIDFFHNHSHSHQVLEIPHSSPPVVGLQVHSGPRNYKSRKYRPCDFCRARQVACKIDSAPPCQLCRSHAKDCTFVERPKKKRRPNNSSNASNGNGNGVPQNGNVNRTVNGHEHGHGQENINGEANILRHIDPSLTLDHQNGQIDPRFVPQFDEQLFERSLGHDHYLDQQHQGVIHNVNPQFDRPGPGMSNAVQDRPLDSQLSRSARFIGETGESNPYLLRHYLYDENDECTVSKLTYRRIKRVSRIGENMMESRGEPPVVFMLADDSLAQKGEPKIEDDVLSQARHDVSQMFSQEESLRLIGLYFRFVDPYFPILPRSEFFVNGSLSRESVEGLPLSLISALYATALPFMLYDELLATTLVHSPPPAYQLYRISWLALIQELHTPRLATLQACLLLLQRAPTNRFTTDTPWKASLVGWTVSLAQTLGLHHECSNWASLPPWELSLRKRLFHAVFIMDKWASLGAGMPSHIRHDDYDVFPLSPSECEIPMTPQEQDFGTPGLPALSDSCDHFRLLAELTAILSDIMDAYYSVRASRQTSRDFMLSLDLARPLRSRLKAWNESLPPALSLRYSERVDSRGMAKLSGNPSLSLAYIVATMTLFRALLRPLDNLTSVEEEDHGIVGSQMAVRAGAKECAKEVVEFVEGLGRGALDAFWHSWSRANFAIASSFLMQLLLTATTEAESNEIHDLVARWRWAMRIGSGSTGSGLMSLGLLRLDGLLLENGIQQAGSARRSMTSMSG